MSTFRQFYKSFNPYKMFTNAMFGSFVAYQGYQHAFAKDNKPFNADYEKHLQETLHQKSPNAAFLYNLPFPPHFHTLPLVRMYQSSLETPIIL